MAQRSRWVTPTDWFVLCCLSPLPDIYLPPSSSCFSWHLSGSQHLNHWLGLIITSTDTDISTGLAHYTYQILERTWPKKSQMVHILYLVFLVTGWMCFIPMISGWGFTKVEVSPGSPWRQFGQPSTKRCLFCAIGFSASLPWLTELTFGGEYINDSLQDVHLWPIGDDASFISLRWLTCGRTVTLCPSFSVCLQSLLNVVNMLTMLTALL